MATIDLNPDDLRTVQGVLRQCVPQNEVWAFGSRVRWTARENSDLDLAIRTDRPLSTTLLGDLREAFAESNLPIKVDIVDWSTISPKFRAIIEKDHVVLQTRGIARPWKVVRLGDICEIYDGPHATPAKTDEGPIFLGISNLANGRLELGATEQLSESDFKKWTRRVSPGTGDLVFSYETRLGEAALIPEGLRCCLGRRMGLLRANRDIVDPRFLLYAYLGPEFQETIRSRTIHGSTVDRIPLQEMGDFPIRIPPLAEQRAIAHILGTLDDKIELNRGMDETLEAMARALFKSWFVDFDPVRAKAEGRDLGLPRPLADLFPDSFEDSELGEIPKGWRVGTVNDVAEINAKTLSSADSPGVIDYIEISEVMRGEIGTVRRYERGTEPSRARRCLRHGDSVLSTVRPDRGAHFLCLNPSETLIASTRFAVFSPRDGNWAFAYCALTGREIGEELGRLADGGAYPAIRPEAIGARSLVLPPRADLLSCFQRLAAPLFDRTQQNRIEAKALASVRDTLLPKLISGEVRVTGAEKLVEKTV